MIMRRETIPFHQIAAFEAAARHLGFSRAAKELNVQQPAVSRQIAALEADLGVALFIRTKPRLTLTPEGEILANAVAGGFESILSGIRAIRALRQGEALVVNAAIGFTSLYLLPRLAEFQSLHPEIRLEVVTRDQNQDFDPALCDVAVIFGDSGLAGAPSCRVFQEEMVAICRPGYLAEDRPVNLPLHRTALAGQRLLYLSSAEHAGDWQRFFEGSGVHPPTPAPLDRIYSFMVYLRAIQNGIGIGLGWTHLIEDNLEMGSLVLACSHRVVSQRGYHCSIMPRARERPGARTFLDWIGTSG